jgi:hypothetical protein
MADDPKILALREQFNRVVLMQNSLIRRTQLLAGLGQSFNGERDFYTTFGYPSVLSYQHYVNISSREGLGKRVNEAECDAVWRQPPRVFDRGEIEPTQFETAWLALVERQQLWTKLNRADKLLGFGPYAVIFLGFADADSNEAQAQPLTAGAELLYIQTYAAEFAAINKFNEDARDPRYGLPELYELRLANLASVAAAGGAASSSWLTAARAVTNLKVHWSRIIHIVDGNLQSEVLGEARLHRSYNRLLDIQKICGGSAEMFWLASNPGFMAALAPDAQWDPDDPKITEMKDQLDEFEHKLRRMIMVQGVELKSLASGGAGLSNPTQHLDAQLQDLAAGSRIPKRILTGSEMGELASSQDRDNWMDYVDERRHWFAESAVVRPLLNRLIENKILPPPQPEARIDWPDLRTPSEADRATVGQTRANALAAYLNAPGAQDLLPPEAFIRYCLGLSEEAVRDTLEWYEEQDRTANGDSDEGSDQDGYESSDEESGS